ncbi:MAG: YjgP/YjgQ family permease [Chitinophagaceae bacterium]|nr:YjgP/YjgQ family permease [Chitinophagaceae bacterium]
MKKLDWYILKKFLITFFFCILLFTIIAVVIDISEKTDDFVKSGLTTRKIITNYYFGFVPHIMALLFPLFVFIAVIFFTSKMAGRSEIIAILASGISYRRMLVPYWIGGILLALMLWFANHMLIPRAQELRTDFEARYVNGNSSYNPLMRTTSNIYFRVDTFTYAGIHYYDTGSKSGGPFFMHKIIKNQLVYNLRAETIRWDTAKKKWSLQTVIERKIHPLKEEVSSETTRDMNFNFKPFDLSRDEYAKNKLTTPELNQFIKLEELRGSEQINELKIERYKRDASAASVMILTLIGVAVASRKVRGGSGMHLAIGFLTAAMFILTDRFSTIFSTKGNLPPLLAAWIPAFIFIVVAYFFYRRAPK